jgi:3-phosphoshikimate 1-carboxyvinyltransferase
MARMKIQPALRITGKLSLSGDKSISHRAALIAALAEGRSVISNFSTSADCNSTLNCLRSLGVAVSRTGNEVVIEGTGPSGLKAPAAPLDCGNSGSTMRMLAGVLAGCDFESVLTGDESLRSRPMKRIIEPLRLMNAEVDSPSGRPPLQIRGSSSIRPISYLLPVASAQVKSCILLAGLRANGETEVIERLGSTRDHTERMLQWFGATVETRSNEPDGHLGTTVALDGPARLSARDVTIPGDISSAAFLIAAAALLPGSDLAIEGIGLNATRKEFLSVLQSDGLSLMEDDVRDECNEPVGTVRVRGGSAGKHGRPFHPGAVNVIGGGLIPKLIDELPLLAVVGSQINGGLMISDAAELRVKEADRISATVRNLRAMGVTVDEFEDGLRVYGPTNLNGAEIESFGDHRIAMAFSVAALLADGPSEIVGADCVAISFPEFFDLLESVTERVA